MIEFSEAEKMLFAEVSNNTTAHQKYEKYFDEIMETAKNKAKSFAIPDEDVLSLCDVTYLPNHSRFSLGLGEGLHFKAECKTYKTKEKAKIRANCLNYSKIYRKDGRIIKVEIYFDGEMGKDDAFWAYYEGDYRYLFSVDRCGIGDWTFITHFENGKVTEEFTFNIGSLLYERYSDFSENRVKYYSAFYVPGSYCKIQSEDFGYYELPSLNFVKESSFSYWDVYKNITEARGGE